METITQIFISFFLGVLASAGGTYFSEYVIKARIRKRTTWKKVEIGLKRIIKKIANSDSGFKPEAVLGMKRSGTALASMIAGNLDSLPVTTIDYELSKHGDLGELKANITVKPNYEILSGKNVLVVTCFNKTGEPMNAVIEHLNASPKRKPKGIRTVSFYADQDARIRSNFFAFREDTWSNRLLESMPWMISERYRFPHILLRSKRDKA